MKMAVPMLAVLAPLLLGCFQMKKAGLVSQMDTRPDFKLCLLNGGVEPIAFEQCIQQSQNEEGIKRCATPEQRPIIERCALESDAAANARTHTTTCNQVLFGGVQCTSN